MVYIWISFTVIINFAENKTILIPSMYGTYDKLKSTNFVFKNNF